jgi:phospholipid/cholesterol/gamma-HCH transport system ATP-binding protein
MTEDIYNLFARTQKQVGYTAVIVSHDIPKVFRLADQIVVLNEGKTDVFANPEAMQKSQAPHIRAFVKSTMGAVNE